jgi:hypothetical protein
MSLAIPKGHSVSDIEIDTFVKLPGVSTIATLPTELQASQYGLLAYVSDSGGGYYVYTASGWIAVASGATLTSALVANSTGASAANTALIQAALNLGGLVSINKPGVIWIDASNGFTNAALLYGSNTRISVGPNTTIKLAAASNVAMIMSTCVATFLAGGLSLTGGTAVTLTQNSAPCSVNVLWTTHGLTAGQAVMIANATGTGQRANPYNGIFVIQAVVDANNFTINTNYPATAAPAGSITALQATQNVRFEGGGTWDGNGPNQTNTLTIRNHLLMVAGVEGIVMDNITVTNCKQNGVPIQYARNVTVRDLRSPNSDNALQLMGPCTSIYVRGIVGYSNDDFMAIAPGPFVGDAYLNAKGDIIDVRIENVDATAYSTGTILHIYPTDNQVLDDINVDGLVGNSAASPIQVNIYAPSGNTHGYFGRLRFKNVQPCVSNNAAPIFAVSACTGDSLTIEDSSFLPGVTVPTNFTGWLNLTTTAVIRNLVVNRLRSNGFPSASGTTGLVFVGGASINKIMCRDWDIQSAAASGQLGLIRLASASNVVKDIVFEGGSFDASVLDFVQVDNGMTGQTTFNVTFIGIETSGANGNGTGPAQGVHIGSGVTQNCNVKFIGCGTLNFTTSAILQGSGTIAFKLASAATDWGSTVPISSSGTYTITAYGMEIPLDAGLVQTTKGQFFTHASAVAGRNAANQQGPCIAVDGTHFYALGTGTSGVNTLIL